jgi:hypothetical protein
MFTPLSLDLRQGQTRDMGIIGFWCFTRGEGGGGNIMAHDSFIYVFILIVIVDAEVTADKENILLLSCCIWVCTLFVMITSNICIDREIIEVLNIKSWFYTTGICYLCINIKFSRVYDMKVLWNWFTI